MDAVGIISSYENITALCPSCGTTNVYNRVSDIGHTDLVDHATVVCENKKCGHSYDIIGDSISPPFEMLISDAQAFVNEKRYIQAVLSATTAYEVFFCHFLQVELVIRPIRKLIKQFPDQDIDLNAPHQLLMHQLERLTFQPLRNTFIRHLIENQNTKCWDKANVFINTISKKKQPIDRGGIELITNLNIRNLCYAILDDDIADTRNAIVHKHAHRPSRVDTQELINRARANISRAKFQFRIEHINYHLNEPI